MAVLLSLWGEARSLAMRAARVQTPDLPSTGTSFTFHLPLDIIAEM